MSYYKDFKKSVPFRKFRKVSGRKRSFTLAQANLLNLHDKQDVETENWQKIKSQISDEAKKLIAYIRTTCRKAESDGILNSANHEAAFTVRTTLSDYLPDTIAAYASVTPSKEREKELERDQEFVRQLGVLVGALDQAIAILLNKTDLLNSNGDFLAERFPEIAPVTEVPECNSDDVPTTSPLQNIPNRWSTIWNTLSSTSREAGNSYRLEFFHYEMARIFSANTTVQLNIFGRLKSVIISIPRDKDRKWEYKIVHHKSGFQGADKLEYHKCKNIRGTRIWKEQMELYDWFLELTEELDFRYPHVHQMGQIDSGLTAYQ